MTRRYYLHHFVRDVFIVAGSIVMALALVKIGLFEAVVGESRTSLIFTSFVVGAFFTSLFTVAPAGVALVAIGEILPAPLVALVAATGAACIDIIIISFIRKDLVRDLRGLARTSFRHHLFSVFHFGFLKWVAFLLGMFLIATPLPDELGLFLIGISKIDHKFLPLVFFLAHFLGIWAMLSIANTV